MKTRSQTGFAALQTEGAILPADLLRRISEGDGSLGGMEPGSFHLPAGERVSEAVSRSWSRLQGSWAAFQTGRSRLADTDTGTTLTREKWLLPLFQELGFGRLTAAKPVVIGEKTYALSHGWQHAPIHLLSFRLDLDKRQPGATGASRSSPHSLVQELLNRSSDHLWGFLTNGLRLRILRDNASLSRQAFVEFDLEAIFDGELYADFALLWLLCHQSRIEGEKPDDCWLEKWSRAAKEQGTRALDRLRTSVECAISALGAGFLSHPANGLLRERLQSGSLPAQEYYRELLRHVYRLLFLFVAEDRELLHEPKSAPEARHRYARFFSTKRLRRLALTLRGSRHGDLYASLRLVSAWLGSADARPEVGLPALGGYLFSESSVPQTWHCALSNQSLLEAVRALCLTEENGVRRAVDFRNLRAEELGSIYESLLELSPEIDASAATFALRAAAGNERKTTGSYYTPDSLVQSILKTALDPVIERAASSMEPETALLDLKVCDPSCGSGHFLVSAAHRIAKRLASVRNQEDEPSPEASRRALRDVIGRCIFGVDLNPMAVELCKVALWMEALEPGRPLSFLDHHVVCGNSLLGTTPTLLAKGIPDEAFDPIVGDDKHVCSALKKRNGRERAGQRVLPLNLETDSMSVAVRTALAAIGILDDATIEAVREKEKRWRALAESGEYRRARLVADAWCAAFLWPKRKDGPPPITHEILEQLKLNPRAVPRELTDGIAELSDRLGFFHWHLAFPDVASAGGFSCVVGNPPWENLQADPQEFFAVSAPSIAAAPNMADRHRLIEALRDSDTALYGLWLAQQRNSEGTRQFLRGSGRYPLSTYGRLNTYSLFAELAVTSIQATGRCGLILPVGIATDAFNQYFFADLVQRGRLASFFGFENEAFIFPQVHHSFKFALMTVGGEGTCATTELAFSLRAVDDLSDEDRRYELVRDDFALMNPNTITCPVFRRRHDAELTAAAYRRWPVLLRNEPARNPWGIKCQLMFMTNTVSAHTVNIEEARRIAGEHLRPSAVSAASLVPLYEGKMFHQFDHRFGTYEGQTEAQANQGKLPELTPDLHADPDAGILPRYWLPKSLVDEALSEFSGSRWLVSWRDVTSAVVLRTVIAALLPYCATNDSAPLVHLPGRPAKDIASFLACLNSFALDFVARQKLGGNHLRFFTFFQLPILPPEEFERAATWAGTRISLGDWVLPRVLELVYTSWDLNRFADECGLGGAPFRWNEERRFRIRCELDAALFHVYFPADEKGGWLPAAGQAETDLSRLRACFATPRDGVAYIMDTFSILKRRDEERFEGDYRTKRVILNIYDEIAEAMRTGGMYETQLNPPPGAPSARHRERNEMS